MQKPIPDIIAFILDIIYGQITPQDLSDGKDEVRYFAYKPWKPIDLVFNKITKFKDLCKLCKEKNEPQVVQQAYLILSSTRHVCLPMPSKSGINFQQQTKHTPK